MKANGFLVITEDKIDKRKKQIQLSEKAYRMLPQFEEIWLAGRKAMTAMLQENPEFMRSTENF